MKYKLSPSDFKYLWGDCKHCYYNKVVYGISLPSIGMPGVFSRMNSLLQETIHGKNLQEINPDLPSGIIEAKEKYLKSIPIPPKNVSFIHGRFDVLSRLDDGSFAVIDFKITNPSEERLQKFTHQLHAYKFALENPLNGEMAEVSRMGIIAISPEEIEFKDGTVTFHTVPTWYEVKEDMDSFFSFIEEVSSLLEGPIPEPTNECKWCSYRARFQSGEDKSSDIPF